MRSWTVQVVICLISVAWSREKVFFKNIMNQPIASYDCYDSAQRWWWHVVTKCLQTTGRPLDPGVAHICCSTAHRPGLSSPTGRSLEATLLLVIYWSQVVNHQLSTIYQDYLKWFQEIKFHQISNWPWYRVLSYFWAGRVHDMTYDISNQSFLRACSPW